MAKGNIDIKVTGLWVVEKDGKSTEIPGPVILNGITLTKEIPLTGKINAHDLAEMHLGVYEAERILRNG